MKTEMYLPDSDGIAISKLSRLFDKMSESYKIFWFQAIIDRIHQGETVMSFSELIDHMIVDAWYMVAEYKLNLGPSDNLEGLVHYVYGLGKLKSSEKKERILKFLMETQDEEILRRKRILTQNVPYRLQAPFLDSVNKRSWNRVADITSIINSSEYTIYKFDNSDQKKRGLNRQIVVTPHWKKYIETNYAIIKAWIQYNLITYLQRRNPSVPGIPNKLYPPAARKLEKVKKYWKAVIDCSPVMNIYTGDKMTEADISIDHFIPWSYVAHDELWNLIPTTKSVNSSKSNDLPDWDKYFSGLCRTEYEAYQQTMKKERIEQYFKACQKEHLNNDDIRVKLYKENIELDEFGNVLGEIVEPVYKAARNMGFGEWGNS